MSKSDPFDDVRQTGPTRILEQASKNFQTALSETAQFSREHLDNTTEHATRLAALRTPQEIAAQHAAYCQTSVGLVLNQIARAFGLCGQMASEMTQTVTELQDSVGELSEQMQAGARRARDFAKKG